MRIQIQRRGRPSIAPCCRDPLTHLDIRERVIHIRRRSRAQPILGRGVAVTSDEHRWQARHGVVDVSYARCGARLRGDPGGEGGVAYARRAVGVEVGGIALGAYFSGGESGDCTAEAVAGDDDLVGGVLGASCLEGGQDGGTGLVPGGCEAGVGGAAGAPEVDVAEVEVGDEVADGGGAAEGEDDFLADRGDGEEAFHVGEDGAGYVSGVKEK